MVRKLFGTDGIRGAANQEPMTAETALKVGMAAGRRFLRGNHRHRVLIGKDTRLSGYMIEPALTAGFVSVGMDVILVGPMPTPAVAMLTRSLRADLGVMISASHNPHQDNGIKLFGPDGYKLSDAVEHEIEAGIENGLHEGLAAPEHLGRAQRLEDAQGRYIEWVKSSFPKGRRLSGLKIVIDCANGAAYRVAPTVLWELEAEVVPIGVGPDGFNINKGCGSTVPATMQEAVIAHGADLGITLDGDADRVLIADETGKLIDGDQLMALISEHWQKDGRLTGGGVVATVMSNFGLERFLGEHGIALYRTRVGDRYVVEEMRRLGCNFGGEQSGHIIMTDFVTTGDGLIAALQVLSVVVEQGRPLSEVCRRFTPMPQILRNVPMPPEIRLDDQTIEGLVAGARRKLAKHGRLIVRRSGTEPVIRVMGEGENEALVIAAVEEAVGALRSRLAA